MLEDISRIEARADALVEAHEELMRSLIALRKQHKISQETVAERMSVSQPTVAAFERYDSNPTLSTIRRYALAVGGRIQNSVIDDCEEHARAFETLVELELTHLPMKVQNPRKSFWHAPKIRTLADA
jgi:transcriptional regulator with XRE-family HTH domain